MADEEWRAIPDYPGYEVSDHGRVRSIDREVVGRGGFPKNLKGKVLAQGLVGGSKPGGRYYSVTLFRQGKRKPVMIHTLVLAVFKCPRPEGLWGCHKDDDPANNILTNLYWGTPTQNAQDAVRSGRHASAAESRKTRCPQGHEYTEENTYRKPKTGHRNCRTCHRDEVNEANRIKRLLSH